MSRPRVSSAQRFPGESLALTQMFVLGTATVAFAVALMAKSFPADAGLFKEIARNYGANIFLVPPCACATMIAAQFVGRRARWSQRALWSRTMTWVVPTLWLGIFCFAEADQFIKGHGDRFDLLAQMLGWMLTVTPLAWADRNDRRRVLAPATIQPS